MKIVRFTYGNSRPAYGIVREDFVFSMAGDLYHKIFPSRRVAPLDQVCLLAPCQPSKIIAVGLNYRAHADEHGKDVPSSPLIFFKPPSAIIGPHDAIVLPAISDRVDHEAELCVVIGKKGRNIPADRAMEYILGYTCGNDVTARDLQATDGQWTRSKGFDTFCPLGPWIETELDPASLAIIGRVNGQIRQQSNTREIIVPVSALIEYISSVMTLNPGDLVMTGTPAGVGKLVPGDTVEVEIEGIGVLRNPVAG